MRSILFALLPFLGFSLAQLEPGLVPLPRNKYGPYADRNGELAPMYPFISGRGLSCAWGDVEAEQGVFNFTSCEAALRDAHAHGLYVTINPETGAAAPLHWLKDAGVPVVDVCFKVKNCSHPTPSEVRSYPYYLAPVYTTLWKSFHQALHDWLVQLPQELQDVVESVQVSAGSTGDVTPWHGTPANTSYMISSSDWRAFWVKSSKEMVQIYRDLLPKTYLLFNAVDDTLAGEWPEYLAVFMEDLKPPNFYIKCGVQSHQYGTNYELDQYHLNGNLTRFAFPDGRFVRSRGESSDGNANGGPGKSFWENPTWNLFSMMNWDLTFGLDMHNPNPQMWSREKGVKDLWTPTLWVPFQHYHTYAGQKTPSSSPGAWVQLRDALDFADIIRFPSSIYGNATQGNRDRAEKIVKQFRKFGAAIDDMDAATASRHASRARDGLNDGGYRVWPHNYAQYITQINPQNTSQGRWRVGNKSAVTGRYARQTLDSHAMSFTVDPSVFSTHNGDVHARVVYFDEGKGTWSLQYTGKNSRFLSPLKFKKGNTHRWLEANVTLPGFVAAKRGSPHLLLADATHSSQASQHKKPEAHVFSFIELSKAPFRYRIGEALHKA